MIDNSSLIAQNPLFENLSNRANRIDIFYNPNSNYKRFYGSIPSSESIHRVSLKFDRQRITTCLCTCFGANDDMSPSYLLDGTSISDWPLFYADKIKRLKLLQRKYSGYMDTENSFGDLEEKDKFNGNFTQVKGHNAPNKWCRHVVTACLMRIRHPDQVVLRSSISDSLAKLSKVELLKFAQNLICYVGPKKVMLKISFEIILVVLVFLKFNLLIYVGAKHLLID